MLGGLAAVAASLWPVAGPILEVRYRAAALDSCCRLSCASSSGSNGSSGSSFNTYVIEPNLI